MQHDLSQMSAKELRRNLEEAGTRLQEAQATLQAIQKGKVDALVIRGQQGEQIMTLKGVDQFTESILDASSEALLICDREGRIQRASEAAFKLCGSNPELQRIESVLPLHRGNERFDLDEAIREGHSHRALEVTLETREAGRRHLLLSSSPIQIKRNSMGSLVILVDITDRIRAEQALRLSQEQLRHSQKMEAIGRLAGGIAHDFNNLLTAINGYSELLMQRLEKGSDLLAQAAEIRQAGERAAELTSQLLAYSRKQVLSAKVLDINDQTTSLKRMIRRLIGEHIELHTQAAAGIRWVKIDPTQYQQVMLNLTLNARDAMPEGGRLMIDVNTEEVTSRESGLSKVPPGEAPEPILPGRYAVVTVKDTGQGMSPEVMDHLFEPFYTTKKAGKGTGLGLAMSYGIVRQSGGFFQVFSEPGKGTTFKIFLPLVRQEPPSEPGLQAVEAPLGGGTRGCILLVEDEESVLNLVRDLMKAKGYTVLAAGSGRRALELLDEWDGPVDLVLTDVIMGGMGGRELSEKVLGRRPHVPVLFMSGYTDDEVIRQGVLDRGANFIAKPFTPDALLRKVERILRTNGKKRNAARKPNTPPSP